jgi:hypothetical protein
VRSVDFSDSFRSEIHSFTGSASQKSELKTFRIYNSPQIDFIPVEVFSEFHNLNGFYLFESKLPATIKSGFFTKDFDKTGYLSMNSCKIQSIDQDAFKHLIKLRWIRLYNNQIKSFHFLIFKNNPDLIYIDIRYNQINSVNPDLFKNLGNLKYILFSSNKCINKDLGCETCSISQSDLNTNFSTCFTNCLNNVDDCEIKSKLEKLSQDKIIKESLELEQQKSLYKNLTENMENISTNLLEEITRTSEKFGNIQNNFSMLNETIDNLQEIVKIAENSCKSQVGDAKKILESQAQVIEEAAKARQVEVENQLNIFSEQFNRSIGNFEEGTKKMIDGFERSFKKAIMDNMTNALSANLEKTEGKVEKIVENLSLKFSEIKALMEVEKMQWKLKEAEHTIEKINFQLKSEKFKNEKLAMELQIEKMKKEYAEKLESREAELKKELDEKYGEMIDQKMVAFKNELRDDFRP